MFVNRFSIFTDNHLRWVSHVLKGIPLRTNRHFVCLEDLFPAGARSGYSDTSNPPAAEFESHFLTFSQGNQPGNSLVQE